MEESSPKKVMIPRRNLQSLLEEDEWLTKHLSNHVRTVGFSIILALWAILNSSKISLSGKMLNIDAEIWLRTTFILVIVSLLFDFLQYLVSYRLNRIKLFAHEKIINEGKPDEFEYDEKAFKYRFTIFAFWAKMIAMLGVLIAFLGTLVAMDITG